MKMGWIMGWAVPEAWFAPLVRQHFPNAPHTFIPAGPESIERLLAAGPFDQVTGYSLGSELLLSAAARGVVFKDVKLLAPIFAFAREEDLGGRVARAQVRLLIRWLRRDPTTALADFYGRAGLDVPHQLAPVQESDNLIWGLEYLENQRVEPPLPASWQAWCGGADALLDARRLVEITPGILIVPHATHHPADLLHAMAEKLP